MSSIVIDPIAETYRWTKPAATIQVLDPSGESLDKLIRLASASDVFFDFKKGELTITSAGREFSLKMTGDINAPTAVVDSDEWETVRKKIMLHRSQTTNLRAPTNTPGRG